MNKIKITVIIDDLNLVKKGYVKSFGIAIVIELNKKIVLFDTGDSEPPLLSNLRAYGISPASIDAVILSHNHNDHTDGLPGILRENEDIPVYIHKDWDRPASFKGFQVPSINRVVIQKARELNEVTSHLFITNSYHSSDYGGIYEHACYIKAENSYILLCGCCHPGLNRFLEDREILGIPKNAPLHIIGGMHGFKFKEDEAKSLSSIVRSIVLFHCTMNEGIYKEQFGEKCQIGIVGKVMQF